MYFICTVIVLSSDYSGISLLTSFNQGHFYLLIYLFVVYVVHLPLQLE